MNVSVVRPSVRRLSTFSNDISSEAVRPILFIFIPPVYEVYRGYIVFAFSVTMFVCLCVCKLFFSSKISQELLDIGS